MRSSFAALKPICFTRVSFALAAVSCGRVGLDPAVGDGADASAVVDATPKPDARAPFPDARDDPPPVGPPFSLIVRLTNVGADDYPLQFRPSLACSDDLLIQGAAPVEEPTSIQEPDHSCDCSDCTSSNGRPRCQSTEFICDEPPLILRPGNHFDFVWGGTVVIWLPLPPAGSGCVGLCSAFVSVPAGDYAFTFQSSTRTFVVQSPLPPPGGVVEIPIHFR